MSGLSFLVKTYRQMDFYKAPRWEALRNSILRRDGYMCQVSKRYGKMKPAEIVHHIFPRDEFPEYEYESWNLISLTRAEHNRMHDRDTDGLTEVGAELLRRTARQQGVPIPEQYRRITRRNNKHERRMAYGIST